MAQSNVTVHLNSYLAAIDENGISFNAVLQTNGIMDWPKDANGNYFKSLEVSNIGLARCHIRSGVDALVATDCKRFSDVSDQKADRCLLAGATYGNLERSDPSHTKLTFRCETGAPTTIVINPGVTRR